MRGGKGGPFIVRVLNRFIDENWEKEVTTRMVKEWIVATTGVDISAYVLGQHLSKHGLFQFIKRTNKGRLYRVVSPLDKWMDELKTV